MEATINRSESDCCTANFNLGLLLNKNTYLYSEVKGTS